MQKKFKEYRMFIVCLLLLFFFIGMGIYCFMIGEKIKMIAMILFSLIALVLLLGRYKMVLSEDCMIIYEWKYLAMFPTMIEYQDIQSIEKKSKHHILIQHQRITHIYVFDSDLFIKAYLDLKK